MYKVAVFKANDEDELAEKIESFLNTHTPMHIATLKHTWTKQPDQQSITHVAFIVLSFDPE